MRVTVLMTFFPKKVIRRPWFEKVRGLDFRGGKVLRYKK